MQVVVVIKQEPRYQLELSLDEARWLRDYLQNSHIPYKARTNKDTVMRELFYDAIDRARWDLDA